MRRIAISAVFLLCSTLSLSFAQEKITVTTFYPSPNGVYAELKAVNFSVGSATGYMDNHSITDGYMLVSNRVGVGVSSPAVALEVADNQTIKIGAAYLSSGGNFAHLATNEYYTTSGWVTSAAGMLFQISGTGAAVYYHDSAGGHAQWGYVTGTSGWQAGSSRVYKQNIRKLGRKDYDALREQFRKTDLFSYNRKDTPKEPEVGFIAEESPELILGADKSHVTLLKAIGYYAAIIKGQDEAISSLKAEIGSLKSEIKKLHKTGKSGLK